MTRPHPAILAAAVIALASVVAWTLDAPAPPDDEVYGDVPNVAPLLERARELGDSLSAIERRCGRWPAVECGR